MGNWVESQPKEPSKRQRERERGGCGELAEGACLPVMRHEIDLHTWNNLKALTCCAPNWTFFGPQQPATAKRYTHTHTESEIQIQMQLQMGLLKGANVRVCCLPDGWSAWSWSLSLWSVCVISLERICLIQSCLSSRRRCCHCRWAANHACNMPPRQKIKDEFTLSLGRSVALWIGFA